MKLVSSTLLVLASSLAAPALAHEGELDQVAPITNTWFHCYGPELVWQQQIRVGMGGILDAFELYLVGPVGAQAELRIRRGDGWNVGPVVWSTSATKTTPNTEIVIFDVADAKLTFSPGDTFVLEAQGNGTDLDIRGSYVNPASGPSEYPEELYLNGPGCYEDCGYNFGFRTWMIPDTTHNYCGSLPNSTGAAAVISDSGSVSVAANDLVLSAGPAPVGKLGMFIYGPEPDILPFANGILCVGAGATGIARLPVGVVDGAGFLTHAVDNTAPPKPKFQILPGSTWYFQAWFRDPAAGGAGLDLSDGLEIVFWP